MIIQNIIEIKDEKIELILQKKKMKNIIIKVKPDLKIYVSAPIRLNQNEIYKIINQKKEWIYLKIKEIKKANIQKEFKNNFEKKNKIKYILGNEYKQKVIKSCKEEVIFENDFIYIKIKNEEKIKDNEYIEKVYLKWENELIKNIFTKVYEKYNKEILKYNIGNPILKIRKMKSRWGSCIASKNQITLSTNLIMSDLKCIEYVMLHEMAHLKHQNHSKEFYNFIENIMPEYKIYQNLLKHKYSKLIQ